MGYVTMQHACFLAGTTKNPIKRAISLGDIYAYKDNLGRWQIGEKTFLNWLLQRRGTEKTSESCLDYETGNGCARHEAIAPSRQAEPSKLIANKLCDITHAEEDAWRYAAQVPTDARSVYIKHLTMIEDQKLFLKALRQIK